MIDGIETTASRKDLDLLREKIDQERAARIRQTRERARDQLIDELNRVVANFTAEEVKLFFSEIDLRNFLKAGGKVTAEMIP
jgi:hypothetical protein